MAKIVKAEAKAQDQTLKAAIKELKKLQVVQKTAGKVCPLCFYINPPLLFLHHRTYTHVISFTRKNPTPSPNIPKP